MVFAQQPFEGIGSHRWHADGVRVENIPGTHDVGHLRRDSKLMKSIQCEPEHFSGRIIFMSMFHDIVLGENGNTEECIQNSIKVSKYARRFPCGRWSFLKPGSEKEWYKTCSDKPDGKSGQNCRNDDTQIKYTIWSPNFSSIQCFRKR